MPAGATSSVREQVVEYLLDPARGDEGVRAAVRARLELDVLLLGQRRPGLDALVHRGGDIELNGRAGGPVGTSEGEQPVDERAEALEFVERALQFLALVRLGVLGEVPRAAGGARSAGCGAGGRHRPRTALASGAALAAWRPSR